MKLRLFLSLIVFSAVIFSGCKKTPEYVAEPYACKCGSFNWRGNSYDLLDANYILSDSLVDMSRRYYITGDVKEEGQAEPHSVNFIIEIPDVTTAIFDLTEDEAEFEAEAQQVNQNDDLIPVKYYRAVSGRVTVAPAFFGGSEQVRYSVFLQEVFNGTDVGSPFPFTGDFTVEVSVN